MTFSLSWIWHNTTAKGVHVVSDTDSNNASSGCPISAMFPIWRRKYVLILNFRPQLSFWSINHAWINTSNFCALLTIQWASKLKNRSLSTGVTRRRLGRLLCWLAILGDFSDFRNFYWCQKQVDLNAFFCLPIQYFFSRKSSLRSTLSTFSTFFLLEWFEQKSQSVISACHRAEFVKQRLRN